MCHGRQPVLRTVKKLLLRTKLFCSQFFGLEVVLPMGNYVVKIFTVGCP